MQRERYAEPLSDSDLAWMAGFFDGEGYIGVAQTNNGTASRCSYALHVAVAQVALEPLRPFTQFGGRIRLLVRGGRERDSHQWGATATEAANCLRALRPYLRLKQEQADIGLAFQARRLQLGAHRSAAGRWTSPARWEADAADYRRLRELKGRLGVNLEDESLENAAPQLTLWAA